MWSDIYFTIILMYIFLTTNDIAYLSMCLLPFIYTASLQKPLSSPSSSCEAGEFTATIVMMLLAFKPPQSKGEAGQGREIAQSLLVFLRFSHFS